MSPRRSRIRQRIHRRCIIKGCPSVSSRQQHRGVVFNRFPLNPIIRQHWSTNCGISNTKSICGYKDISRKSLVCSRHFRRTDFQHLKDNKHVLKEGAVPTVFPWHTYPYLEPTSQTVTEHMDDEVVGRKIDKKSILISSVPIVTASPFSLGTLVEAQDSHGFWHSGKVVDCHVTEVLIWFKQNDKSNAPVTFKEWIPINSNRFRPYHEPITTYTYVTGEKCLAKWTLRKHPATVQKVLENNSYEILFDDGFVKVLKGYHLVKVNSPEFSKRTNTVAGKYGVQETNTHMQIPKIDLSKLNLMPVPKDGEWCCNWVNGVPVGVESYIEGRYGFKRPTLILEDWRLPVGWTKHVYPKPQELGKWNVVLVGPENKLFRFKKDVDEKGEVYNPDIADFSTHVKRAKDLGLYILTDEYKEELKNRKLLALKALEENLFCCPECGCNKKFRKEKQLHIHIRNSHEELANKLGICIDIEDQEDQHFDDHPTEELILKNELSDSDTESETEYQDDQSMEELISKNENSDTESDLENQHIDMVIDEMIPKNEILDADELSVASPVAIYQISSPKYTQQVDTFFISYVDTKYD